MINRQRGKNNERALAKRLGGKRVGILCGEDISHQHFSIECKSRVAFAGEKFIIQAERNCPIGKTPLAIVHILKKGHGNDIVMMRLKDWEDWFGKLKKSD